MGTGSLVSIAWYCPPTNEYFSGLDCSSDGIPSSSAATGCQPLVCGATATFAPVLLPDGFSNTSGSWWRKSARSGPYTSVASWSISMEILFPASATLLNSELNKPSSSAARAALTPSISVTLVMSFVSSGRSWDGSASAPAFSRLGHQRREQRRIGLPAAQAADIHRLSYLGAAHLRTRLSGSSASCLR